MEIRKGMNSVHMSYSFLKIIGKSILLLFHELYFRMYLHVIRYHYTTCFGNRIPFEFELFSADPAVYGKSRFILTIRINNNSSEFNIKSYRFGDAPDREITIQRGRIIKRII